MNELLRQLFDAMAAYVHRVMTYDPIVVAVELLLIGVVVAWVAHFLRGTRGARLIKGVAVVMVGFFVVIRMLPHTIGGERHFGWERIEFLYRNFLLFAFFAVVVAFQPEMRRALMQIGQAKLFRGVRGQVDRLIDSLVESAAFLSRNKIGALIAVERLGGLASVQETGTPVDAEISPGLLNTIFYPGSPLHDMGVVIRHGRVSAAGCQFPLAESDEVDSSLGSRHRAALGLAQDSDAVVLVVSEETGRVSLAVDGQLYIGLEMENLRAMLVSLLAPRKVFRGRRRPVEEGSP